MLALYTVIMVNDWIDNITLIIRVWAEGEHNGDRLWRGSIQRIPENDRLYFQSLDDCIQKVTEILDDLNNDIERLK
jgi:hypothetical protein